MPYYTHVGMLRCLYVIVLCMNVLLPRISFAGGFDSSGQSFHELFGDGHAVNLRFNRVNPNMTLKAKQTDIHAARIDVSEMAKSYNEYSASLRYAFSDNIACLLKLDQPFKFETSYKDDYLAYVSEGGSQRYAPLSSKYDSQATNALCRIGFDFEHRVRRYSKSHFYWILGLRSQSINGVFSSDLTNANLGSMDNYLVTLDSQRDWGASFGFAYEKPEIAFLFSMIYHSEIDHDLSGIASAPIDGVVSNRVAKGKTKTPQSINVRFQTGLTESLLAYVNLRWGDWSKIRSIEVAANELSQSIPLFESDTLNYQIGLGKKITERFSMGTYFASLIDLDSKDLPSGVDGSDIRNPQGTRYSVGLGGRFKMTDKVSVSAGGSYFYLKEALFQEDFYTVKLNRSSAYAFSTSLEILF